MKANLFFILLLSLLISACTREQSSKSQLLNSGWSFRKAGDTEWKVASVPGCVHTDLLKNDLIPDPFFRKNELDVKWVENSDWEYQTTFKVSDDMAAYSNLELQFEGLDTYADVYLNDSLVLKADNMFVGYTFPVKELSHTGENLLRIYFHSAVNIGMEKLKKVPYLIMAANELAPENERSNVFTRKAPFHYGWDWGPRLVTCGIWKPIKLTGWNEAKMNNLYVKPVQISELVASYRAIIELNEEIDETIGFEILVDGIKQNAKVTQICQKDKNQVTIDFTIEKPEFWWTNGLGGQKLYTVEVHMKKGNSHLQSLNTRIGVRTLELVREKDSIGHTFYFKLNGVPVFMKGANYIPSDIFTTRNTNSNYKRVVDDAVEANMNMLRIWGGAIYENDEFYDLLDEKGILAWNDFMFSCNMQPNDSLHLENIRKEAEYNVQRLRNHPSIALWCGNNENLRAWNDWGWPEKVTKEQAAELWNVYEKIFYDILPKTVAKYHPEITYWPSSPQAENNRPSNYKSGDEHDWRIWFGDVPFSTYAVDISRFVSEYGLQSFPEMKTIRAFADENDLAYRSPIMEHRQRSLMPWIAAEFNGNEMINTYINRYYKPAKDFESFVYLSQVMQAEGVKFAIEAHRGNMPYTMGTLYWQINDCWPTMSWSGIDYFGRWKALHYTVKNAFQEVYPIIQNENEQIVLKVANDRLKDREATLETNLYDFDGNILWQKQLEITLKANSSHIYLTLPEKELLLKGKPRQMVFEATVKFAEQQSYQNLFYFRDCKELELENTNISRTMYKINANEYEIEMSTNKLAKNVMLFAPKSEIHFSENNFDMIPGKTYKIKANSTAEITNSDIEISSVADTFIK